MYGERSELRVIIDPGHGGNLAYGGSSATGVEPAPGLAEKHVNLELARRVANRLGSAAELTRNGDINVPLRERAQLAARSGARALVSIHANSGNQGTHGSEVWLHERHDPGSAALAQRIHAKLGRVGPTRGVFTAPLALLDPGDLGGAAGCLIEADYLSDPRGRSRLTDPRGLDQLADAIASGIREYLEYGGPSRYGDGDNYFTDTEQLTAYMRDERAADSRRVSSVADAEAAIDAYLSRGAPTVWSGINAQTAASEIRARCSDYRLFQQGNLNLCGPAAFLLMWAGRDPCGYARYALGLLETGAGRIGSRTVTASSSMRALAYPRLGNPHTTMTTPSADFIAMAALRNSTNDILPYDGRRSGELLAGLTRPDELAGWLNDTGAFSTVRDEGNWVRIAGYDHAMNLMPGTGIDVAMLINVNALASARRVETISGVQTSNPMSPDRAFMLNQFPNHFVILLSEMVPDTSARTLSMSVWTWAGSYVFEGVPLSDFMDNYYGAVIGFVRR